MARIRKAEVGCPHCGARQLEPVAAVSTFCRECGQHFDIGTQATAAVPQAPPTPRVPGSQGKRVHCYKCGTEHGVSHFAKTTLCPSCGTFIELANLTITSNTSRPVDIRGHLEVRAGANLNNSWIVCRSAEIEGSLTGTLLCEGELVLSGSGRLSFRAYAGSVLVAKGIRVVMGFPLVTSTIDVRGGLVGFVACGGSVRVHRGGSLEGEIHARRLTIDRGAGCVARVEVRPGIFPDPPLPPGTFAPD